MQPPQRTGACSSRRSPRSTINCAIFPDPELGRIAAIHLSRRRSGPCPSPVSEPRSALWPSPEAAALALGMPFAACSWSMPPKDIVRIAAIGDLHYGRTTQAGSLQPLFAQIAESADVLALAGDLTDYGLVEEARALVKELTAVKVPIVAVLGNHDYESN